MELEKAENYIRKALRVSPMQGFIIDSLGWALYRRGDLENARKWLSLAYLENSEEPEIMFHYAVVLRDMKRPAEADEILAKIAPLDLDSPELEEKIGAAFPAQWPGLRQKAHPNH